MEKRNRVTSADGIWSLITTNQIKGVFYSKDELKKNIQKKKSISKKSSPEKLNSKDDENVKNFGSSFLINNSKKSNLSKTSKKIRRKLNEENVSTKKNDGTPQKTNEDLNKANDKMQKDGKQNENPCEEKKEENVKTNVLHLENLESQHNSLNISSKNLAIIPPETKQEKKKQKMKTIHIVDPKQAEKYLKVLQEHIGIIPKNVQSH